ncbi:palmitoyltransferase ZDHHC16A isoform X2 [Anabrus simplex]|uniref:palmitoyltransferase ZDHHC16A isoform X2 n=1 Tax=Anabrus simplex TaxID=316456 RepID=UPI0035A2AA6C
MCERHNFYCPSIMVQIKWKITSIPKAIRTSLRWQWQKSRLTFFSFFYNHFTDFTYVVDVCMEPVFWFVDNFTKFLGPVFVICVCGLTASVVVIAYWLGVPHWWNRSPAATVVLMIVGHWLLVNICFHYYMAAVTLPGYPPQGALIPEAASICKKCIAPKPPRTHHCSVCNKCILKMDHHCPWLNNCIGHYNHRYFFLYMVYMCFGVLFLMIFGVQLAYNEVWLADEDDVLEGHPVRFNNSILIPMTELMFGNETLDEETSVPSEGRTFRQSCIIYMAFINFGVFVALGSLTLWHARLISKGETSIEAHINKTETKRLAAKNKSTGRCRRVVTETSTS